MSLPIGTQAPDLEFTDVDGSTKTLTSGQETWVIFIPFAFTGVCESEICDIRDNPVNYQQDGRTTVVVSCDSAPSQKAWAEQVGLKVAWKSDFYPHGKISQAFDVFNEELGCANRVSYLIDGSGTIVKVVESNELSRARDFSQYAS
jgi:peroxiredoxin